MFANRSFWLLAGVVLLLAVLGCARAYHTYHCGCVPTGYCPQSPLPYTSYCGCPTPTVAEAPSDSECVRPESHD